MRTLIWIAVVDAGGGGGGGRFCVKEKRGVSWDTPVAVMWQKERLLLLCGVSSCLFVLLLLRLFRSPSCARDVVFRCRCLSGCVLEGLGRPRLVVFGAAADAC